MADDRSEAVHLWAHLELGDDSSGEHTTLLSFSDVWRVAQTLELVPEAEEAPAWEQLQAALAKSRPDAATLVSTIDDEQERIQRALEMLLWLAVHTSDRKQEHIDLIMSMADAHVEQLMCAVQEQQGLADEAADLVEEAAATGDEVEGGQIDSQEGVSATASYNDSSSSEDNVGGCDSAAASDDDDSIAAAATTTITTNSGSGSESGKDLLEGGAERIAELEAGMDELAKDLAASREREADLEEQLQTARQTSLDEGIRAGEFERLAAKRGDDLEAAQVRHREDSAGLEDKVRAQEAQLLRLKEELDVSSEMEQTLARLKDQNEKYRQRIEDLKDVEDQLSKHEERRVQHVDKIHDLEALVETIPSLKAQLEDYKTRATADAQEMRGLRRDLERVRRTAQSLESQQHDLASESQAHHQKARALQQELEVASSREPGFEGLGGLSGLGGTELSPEVTEAMARLERENSSLTAQVDRQQSHHVDRLENDVDDAQRLAASYEEQLDQTKALLEHARAQVAALQKDLAARRAEITQGLARETDLSGELTAAREHHAETEARLRREMAASAAAARKHTAVLGGRADAALWLQRAAWAGEAARLEGELGASLGREESLEAALEEERAALQEAQEQARGLEEAVEEGEQRLASAEAAAEQELADLRESSEEELRAKNDEAAAAAEASEQELEATRAEAAAAAQAAAEASEQELAASEQKLEAARAEAAAAAERHAAAVGGLESRLAEEQQQLKKARFELNYSTNEVEELTTKQKMLQRRILSLSGDLENAQLDGGGGGGSASATLVMEHKNLQVQYKKLHTQLNASQKEVQQLKTALSSSGGGGGGGGGGSGGGGSGGGGGGGSFGGGRVTRSSNAMAMMSTADFANGFDHSAFQDLSESSDRKIKKLQREIRELHMRNSAMSSEAEKRIQDIKGLQQNLSAKEDRVTALELEKQRAIRKFGHLLNAPKGGGNLATHDGKENACETGN